MSKKYYHPQTDFFRKLSLPEPPSYTHGTEDDIREKLVELKPNSWTLRGNQLEGMTDMGKLVQFIHTNYILRGTDEQGLPILEKIDI